MKYKKFTQRTENKSSVEGLNTIVTALSMLPNNLEVSML